MKDFSIRFMRTYDSIPTNVKHPLGATKLHYVDAFGSEFTQLLREIRFVSLTNIMDDAISVEANLTTSNRTKQRNETRRVKEEQPQDSTSQSSLDSKFNMMMKTMQKIMDKFFVDHKNQMKDYNEPQVRNPNFRRWQGPHVPQFMLRGQRNPNQQPIRPPFQENLIDEGFTEQPQNHIHHFGNDLKESNTFITKDEYDSFMSQEEDDD